MKKIIFIIAVTASFIACGGDDIPPEVENSLPTIPALLEPTNNTLCLDSNLEFKWTASTDPEGDVISYEVQIAKSSNFSQIEYTLSSSSTQVSLSLEKGTAYWWRVKVTDNNGLGSVYSAVYKFYTRGDGTKNTAPFRAELISPAVDSVVQVNTVILKWHAAVDVDLNDVIIYDVFFGTENPPTEKIASNLTEQFFEVSLESSKNYYWQIIAKDNHGNESKSLMWKFKTD